MKIKLILIAIMLWLPVALARGATNADTAPESTPPVKEAVRAADETPGNAEIDQTDFLEGYEAYEDQDYKVAISRLYRYVSRYSRDVPEYEWAEFFLGISLKRSGYTHAAADILAHLVTRKPNPKIVGYCLEMFEKMTRTQPFDRDLVINQMLCDQEYGFIENDQADFVNYYQGVYDWEHGFYKWGDEHFSKIDPASLYFYKYQYEKALLSIYRDEIDPAMTILREIIESDCRDEDLKDDARKTLARLLYEKGQYEEADQYYQDIEENILFQAKNLLERAWAHYRVGHAEKAMGLLYAFEAPRFRDYFTPEYYILKSFIYKDVCHYQSAMAVVEEFRARYGAALKNIYTRKEFTENDALLLLLLHRKKINDTWKFLTLLEKEHKKIEEFKEDQELYLYLDHIYNLEIEQTTSDLRKQFKDEYEKYAQELLQYEEEAHLMAYEIGLDMYQRVQQFHYADNRPSEKQVEDDVVVFPFQGEFWNDELADYKVILKNKCDNMEEWDIFFK